VFTTDQGLDPNHLNTTGESRPMNDRSIAPGPAHQDSASENPPAPSDPTTVIISHPLWCDGVDDRQRTYSDRTRPQYDGPSETDEYHRDRVLHVDSGDVGLTVALVQPFDMLDGRLSYVGEPAIELVAHNYGSEGPEIGVDLTVVETEMLISHLQKAIVEHGREDWHLPVGRVAR
jgi:hypothetical protein